MNAGTLIVLAIVAAIIGLAVRALFAGKGSCSGCASCGSSGSGCACGGECGMGCTGCASSDSTGTCKASIMANNMVAQPANAGSAPCDRR